MADTNEVSLIDSYQSDSPVGTEFLRLYHGIKSKEPRETAESFLITSATLGEGKSTTAAMFAITMAKLKKKTLLVDCDMRRPSIHKLLGLYLEEGMTEICDGSLALARAYKETKLPHLSVITAGRLGRNPTEYFEDGHVTKVLHQSKPKFEFIVVDCAPVMPVVDPIVIAPDVTGVVMVVKAGETHRDLVKQATELITSTGANMMGVILNNMKDVLPYQYSYRYSYQYYTNGEG